MNIPSPIVALTALLLASPLALGVTIEDPYVDIQGDKMTGSLDMQGNAVIFNERRLTGTDDGRLLWAGVQVCQQADSLCRGEPGPPGPVGPQGPQGAIGPQGSVGPQGLTGPQGNVGPRGETGPVGPQGLTGPRGDTGATGPQGPVGPRGDQGPPGATGPAGPQGGEGPVGPRGLIWRGAWDSMRSYGPDDAVERAGSAYVATATTTEAPPGRGWELLAAAGAVGEPGPSGPQGERGPAGAEGPQGERGPIGEQGPRGNTGPSGTDGINCWDTNGDGLGDLLTEDTNGDGAVDVGDCKGDSSYSTKRFMDAAWLDSHAEFGEPRVFDAAADRLTFDSGTTMAARLFRTPIAVAGQFSAAAAVEFTLGWAPLTADADPGWFVCDEDTCLGIQTFDNSGGMVGFQAHRKGDWFGSETVDRLRANAFGQAELFTAQLRIGDDGAWGAAWGENGGSTRHLSGSFSRTLDVSQGLWFEAYRNDPEESYQVDFLHLSVSSEE